jgi:hypothetical protein
MEDCRCRGSAGVALTLRGILRHYIAHHRQRERRHLEYYAERPSDLDAIEKAALALQPDGRRHPHQRRIPGQVLNAAARQLGRADVHSTGSFAELHNLVEQTIGDVHGIGPLTVYDTAQRIGAYLDLYPERVYLHAGTREGAGALGLDHRRAALEMQELPEALRELEPCEVEDVLCIYKEELRQAINRDAV